MAQQRSPLPSRLAGALLLAASAACGDPPSAPPEPAMASPEQVAAFLPSVEDARSRIIPTLRDRAAADELQRHLASLSAHLVARRSSQAQRALDEARHAAARYGTGTPARAGEGPEISAVELVLDGAARLLSPR